MSLNLVKKMWERSQAPMAMLLVQVFATGMVLLSKIILNNGTFIFALMAYRHVVAALCVAPFAFYFERGNAQKLSWKVFFWLFLNAFTGITAAMGLYYQGLRDTKASYATNFLNLIPIVTFVFSIFLRMERLGLKTREGKIKTLGAILCVGGAMITCIYKGKGFHIGHHIAQHDVVISPSKPHWVRGTLMLVGSCLSYGTWFIVQVKLLKVFPSKYWTTMLTCVIACFQSTIIGLCLNRKREAWKLDWDLQLVTIVYSGALATATTFCLITWAISIRGPTYPPMFFPLTLIFVTILEAIILGEEITVGNILGTVVIITGLYCFLWGKTNEMKKSSQDPKETTEESTPATSKSTTVQSIAIVPSSNRKH